MLQNKLEDDAFRNGRGKQLASIILERRLISKKSILKRLTTVVPGLFALQFYFVRESLAAELLFSVGFVILFLIGGFSYVVDSVAEPALNLVAAGAQDVWKRSSDVRNLIEAGMRQSASTKRISLEVPLHHRPNYRSPK